MSTFMAIECISWFDIVVRLFYFIICVTEEWNGNCIYMTAWTLSSFCRSTWTKKCIKRSWMCMMELKRISTVKNCNKSGIGRMPEFRTLNLKITGKQLAKEGWVYMFWGVLFTHRPTTYKGSVTKQNIALADKSFRVWFYLSWKEQPLIVTVWHLF